MSDAITMTTAAAATSGGGTATNGKCPTPTLYGETYSIPDQAAVIKYSFGYAVPDGTVLQFERSANGTTGWVVMSPIASASPIVIYQPQSPTGDGVSYYRAKAQAGVPYTDSDYSNVVNVTAPQGSGYIY